MSESRLRRLRPSPSTPFSQKDRSIPRVVVQPLQRFLSTEVASGLVLLVAALAALAWANSPLSGSYERLWATEVGLTFGDFTITERCACGSTTWRWRCSSSSWAWR